MDETPEQRRARLAALRERATAGAENIHSSESAAERAVRFRNYVPRDAALASARGEAASAPASAPASSAAERDAVALALEPNVGDADPASLAPRRANWDLKRDVEGRLEKLERRTRRALADIAREEEARRVAA